LLSPGARDLPALVPTAPGKDEYIVFITDDRQIKECARCTSYAAIPRTTLQDIALNLYGPKTTGQLNPAHISSFTFSDLADYSVRTATVNSVTISATTSAAGPAVTSTVPLVTPTAVAEPPQIQTAIDGADLIVISMLDLNPAYKSSKSLRDFMAQRADALRDKRVVVFAFGAPYYLDTTEISKLTAYFGVYSRTAAAQEAAVRALFGEIPPQGFSPVSITALRYSLLVQTAPDPTQVILLTAGDVITTTAPPGSLEMKIGDKLKLRAGPVYDQNGNIVPDGTQILFVLAYPAEHVEQQQPAVSTHDGIAETTVVIERKGTLEIRAQADPALTSYVIRVNIGDNAASIETIKPTALPTITPEPSPTATDKPTVVVTSIPTPTTLPPGPAPGTRTNLGGFVVTALALIVIVLAALLTLNSARRLTVSIRWRVVLFSWSAGWIGYVLYATGLPGTNQMAANLGWYGSVVIATVISLAVLVIGLVVSLRAEEQSTGPAR
jgi:beta-N-acetylhexosaminidase